LVLFGSETGNAEMLAKNFAQELTSRGVKNKCMALNDYDLDNLATEEMVYCFAATCGQGELPANM
jgi:sulfite reductase alpha subunit-like flavoprotein